MTVETRKHAEGATYVVTTSCPFCDQPIDDGESVAKHLRYKCPETGGGA